MKKTNYWFYFFVLIGAFFTLISSCENEDDFKIVTDIDGNVYNTVKIGSQVWMVENLKTTHLNDGTLIQNATDNTAWVNTAASYCWLNNDSNNKSVYGALYNFQAVETGKLAPKGWHVATDAEWSELINFLGGMEVAGGKMKEAGTGHWENLNGDATNASGFTALPGGFRTGYGDYGSAGTHCGWWSSTELAPGFPWGLELFSGDGRVNSGYAPSGMGFSVRCIMD